MNRGFCFKIYAAIDCINFIAALTLLLLLQVLFLPLLLVVIACYVVAAKVSDDIVLL